MLFVDPPWIGRSVGSILLERALATARDLGFSAVLLDADPAEAFYAKHGAERIGEVARGSIPGRFLPRMRFRLMSCGVTAREPLGAFTRQRLQGALNSARRRVDAVPHELPQIRGA